MSTTDKLLYEHMVMNSEAPYFDCARFKSLMEKGKSKPGFFERLNTWCDNFTRSTRREIAGELSSFKTAAAR